MWYLAKAPTYSPSWPKAVTHAMLGTLYPYDYQVDPAEETRDPARPPRSRAGPPRAAADHRTADPVTPPGHRHHRPAPHRPVRADRLRGRHQRRPGPPRLDPARPHPARRTRPRRRLRHVRHHQCRRPAGRPGLRSGELATGPAHPRPRAPPQAVAVAPAVAGAVPRGDGVPGAAGRPDARPGPPVAGRRAGADRASRLDRRAATTARRVRRPARPGRTPGPGPARRPRFVGAYRYRCAEYGCPGHRRTILDWEFAALQHRLAGLPDDRLRNALTTAFLHRICGPDRDPAFYLGRSASRPDDYDVLGVYWPPRR